MEFQFGNTRCVLQGLQQGPKLSLDGKSMKWLKKGNKGVMLQLISIKVRAKQQEQEGNGVQGGK